MSKQPFPGEERPFDCGASSSRRRSDVFKAVSRRFTPSDHAKIVILALVPPAQLHTWLEVLEPVASAEPAALLLVSSIASAAESASDSAASQAPPLALSEAGSELCRGAVLVVDPSRNLVVRGQRLVMAERRRASSIDALSCSLAAEYGGRVIGLVPSELGEDGLLGLQALKARGAVLLAAGFSVHGPDPLPPHVRDLVDTSVARPALATEVARLVEYRCAAHRLPRDSDAELEAIVGLLERHGAADAGRYGRPFIRRCVRRRMWLHRVPTLEEYVVALREDPDEATALVRELAWRAPKRLRATTAIGRERRDASKRRALEAELALVRVELGRRREELTRANADIHNLLESTRVAALLLDRDLRVRSFTSAAQDLFDMVAADRGKPVTELHRRFFFDDLDGALFEALRTNSTQEALVESEAGRRYTMAITPYRSLDDRSDGIVVTFSDITEQAVMAELGRSALDATDFDAFLLRTLQAVKRTLAVDLCEILQLSEDGGSLLPLARVGWEIRTPEAAPADRGVSALADREPILLDAEALRATPHLAGAHVSAGARVVLRNDQGDPLGLLGVYSRALRRFSKRDLVFLQGVGSVLTSAFQRKDVEETHAREHERAALRRLEDQLRRAERLASLGTFAAGIAHELNNPLSNIALSAEYAEKTADPERRAKLLANIVGNAQRCGQIVESVLRFARDEATRRWLVDVNPVVRHAVDLVKSYVGSERMTVSLDLVEPSPQIVCNPTEMEQVFVNLLRNAVEAHPDRCHIRLRSERAGDRVRIWISDNGPGIAPADRERIFDPFFSTRRSAGGTGLGLSITHRILAAHGGSIRVLNDAGPGATFELDLPREGSEAKEARHGEDLTSR